MFLDEHSFLHKNQKLAHKWSGPHKIIRLKGDANIEIQLRHNNKKTVVHANRLKPYYVASPNSAIHPDYPPNSQASNAQSSPDEITPPLPGNYTHSQQILLPNFPEVTNTAPSPAINIQAQTENIPRRRAQNSSTSSSVSQQISPDDVPQHCALACAHTPARPHTPPLPKGASSCHRSRFSRCHVLQRGQGLEVDRNENETNEGITVNYVDSDNSWTLVQRRKKRKVNKDNQEEKWNAQQKENFLRFVTFTGGSPIKATAMSMLDHQSQTSHSSNQWLSLQSSKLFHLPLRFQPQCNHSPSLQQLLHIQSLLLRLRRSKLHQTAKNVPGLRPFPKKKKKRTSHYRKEQDTKVALPPPLPPPPPCSPTPPSPTRTTARQLTHQLIQQENPEVPSELGAMLFLQSLNIWPLHRIQTFPNGKARYKLAREEKEQLKFLGLQNLFNTNWPKPDPHHKGPGRCKKT